MHKHFSARVVATVIIFIIALLGVSRVQADTSSLWVSSVLSLQKQVDITLPSPSPDINNNVDCWLENDAICTLSTPYGAAALNGTVRFSSFGKFLPVITYIDNRQHYLPIPHSDEAISAFSGPVYGLNLAFNYSFSSSVIEKDNQFKIISPPDGKLTDKAKHLLAADTESMSFSENGRWMVVSDPNVAMLRVNLDTFEVIPFASSFNYAIGLSPDIKTTITNDGHYAVVASRNFNVFKIYDLSSCSAVPDTINAPVSCQSRDLGSFMQQALPGYSFIASARFMDDNTLAVYGVYKNGSANLVARFIISPTNIINGIDYLALGDSYISGEGAFNYMGGTDTSNNKCHLSFSAYPDLIGHELNYNSYHNVACSGALTNDVINTRPDYKSQADNRQISRAQRDANGQSVTSLSSFLPGYIDQLDFVKVYQPKVLTIAIGGNDIGFANILKRCVDPRNIETCYNTYEDRLELVRQINTTAFTRIVQTYQTLKAAGPPNMRLYAIGYPQIAKPGGNCGLNVHLNSDEVLFSQELINYLDTVIQAAASKAGVYYVDTQDALDGHRLCEAEPGSIAMNGLTAGNDTPSKLGGPIGNESYHPNDFGYMLLENKILSATHNLTNPMPAVNLNAAPPAESGQVILNVAHSGRTINTTEFDQEISTDLAYLQTPITITINGSQHGLSPGSSLKAELHSDPIGLGSFTTDSLGNLTAQVTLPSTAPTGYHTMHFYGTDITGQAIDIYKDIYVASSATDLDGDGVPDSIQKCVGLAPSGQDFDKDGIDDACDANITQPPSSSPDNQGPESNGGTGSSKDPVNLAASATQIQTGSEPGLETKAGPPDPGIDTSAILISVADSKTGGPSVLGANSQSHQPSALPDSLSQTADSKYILPGILTMLTGILGLIFKRWVF